MLEAGAISWDARKPLPESGAISWVARKPLLEAGAISWVESNNFERSGCHQLGRFF